ncbi:LysR family transcriptional regulator [Clostridium ljungdahlii]|uniref:LysR family transcriptional regulator n=1 Tax=Clostridium ljungdahlii TaxID=1538 RepID=UPI00386ABBCE
MTFRQMEVFIEVCECKSINKASAVYHVSQQGISKIVRELEKSWDANYFTEIAMEYLPQNMVRIFWMNVVLF